MHCFKVFLHFAIFENAFTITQNALVLHLLENGETLQTPREGSAACTCAGGTAPNLLRSL